MGHECHNVDHDHFKIKVKCGVETKLCIYSSFHNCLSTRKVGGSGRIEVTIYRRTLTDSCDQRQE